MWCDMQNSNCVHENRIWTAGDNLIFTTALLFILLIQVFGVFSSFAMVFFRKIYFSPPKPDDRKHDSRLFEK